MIIDNRYHDNIQQYMLLIRGEGEMKYKIEKSYPKIKENKNKDAIKEDLFEMCLKKGLIEKTPYGYYFKPEFFETLEIYEE